MQNAAQRKVELVTPTRFLSILDFDASRARGVPAAGRRAQAGARRRRAARPASRRAHIALLFEKPSLRTRSTFEIAVRELGGDVIEPPSDVALGGRETIKDVARNLERWVHGAVVRTFAQSRLETFAAAAPRLRVVNALTNEEHPCQALADCLTMIERWGSLRGRTMRLRRRQQQRRALAGAGRDDARGQGAGRVTDGIRAPAGAPPAIARRARLGGSSQVTNDPVEAVRGADAVYTDVWASMGQESEARAAAGHLRAVPGGRRADGARAPTARCSCTAFRLTAATKSPTR